MKYLFFLIFLNSFFNLLIASYTTSTLIICNPEVNCPPSNGKCNNNKCECYKKFWTLKEEQQQYEMKFCSYIRKSKKIAFLLELLLPSTGHFYTKKNFQGIIKLIITVTMLSLCIYCYLFKNKSDENSDEVINEELTFVDKNGDEKKNNGNNFYGKYLKYFAYGFFTVFLIMEVIDVFCFKLGKYTDGKGVPLY